MTPVLVDSNILLDIATEDPDWGTSSGEALARLGNDAPLVINAVIYAEVSIRYETIEEVESALSVSRFVREALPFEAAFLAGKAHVRYRRRGGIRVSPLPDFFIGAHAAVAGYRLLTRDATRYRTYFPSVELISPRGSR